MTHLEIANDRYSLRKHMHQVGGRVVDIVHFKVPTSKPTYTKGKLDYCPAHTSRVW